LRFIRDICKILINWLEIFRMTGQLKWDHITCLDESISIFWPFVGKPQADELNAMY